MTASCSDINPPKRWWKLLPFVVLAIRAFNLSNAQELVSNPGFESGTNDWFSLNGSPITVTAGGHSGAACVGVTLPNGFSPGMGQFITGKLQPGQSYAWSAWLRVSPSVPPPPRSIRLNLYYTDTGTNYVRPIATASLSTTWALVSASFDLTANGNLTNVMIGFDGFSATAAFSFFVDDVSIVNSSPRLAIERTNNSAVVSWPATAAAYSLQSKASVTSANWSSVADAVQTNGTVLSVTLSPTNTSRYFRLKK